MLMVTENSVTFRDPVATSLKTSFQELSPLRIATGNSHLRPSSVRESSLSRTKKKTPSFDEALFLLAQVHSNWNVLLEELSRWKSIRI